MDDVPASFLLGRFDDSFELSPCVESVLSFLWDWKRERSCGVKSASKGIESFINVDVYGRDDDWSSLVRTPVRELKGFGSEEEVKELESNKSKEINEENDWPNNRAIFAVEGANISPDESPFRRVVRWLFNRLLNFDSDGIHIFLTIQ